MDRKFYYLIMIIMLLDILKQHWFSQNEAKAYLAALELWTSPVSKIARKIGEGREATYYTLEGLEKKWYIMSVTKNKIKNYYALDPKKLHEKIQNKADELLASMPEFLALAANSGEKVSVQLYEWFEWFKMAYEYVTLSSNEMEDGECFLTFVWTQKINKMLQNYLVKEFAPWRMKFKTKSKVIVDKKSLQWSEDDYAHYNETSHETLVVDHPVFNLSNEIVIHWKNEVSIMMYWEDDVSALVIKSATLHDALKSIFMLIWDTYPRSKSKKTKKK